MHCMSDCTLIFIHISLCPARYSSQMASLPGGAALRFSGNSCISSHDVTITSPLRDDVASECQPGDHASAVRVTSFQGNCSCISSRVVCRLETGGRYLCHMAPIYIRYSCDVHFSRPVICPNAPLWCDLVLVSQQEQYP